MTSTPKPENLSQSLLANPKISAAFNVRAKGFLIPRGEFLKPDAGALDFVTLGALINYAPLVQKATLAGNPIQFEAFHSIVFNDSETPSPFYLIHRHHQPTLKPNQVYLTTWTNHVPLLAILWAIHTNRDDVLNLIADPKYGVDWTTVKSDLIRNHTRLKRAAPEHKLTQFMEIARDYIRPYVERSQTVNTQEQTGLTPAF